MTHARPSLLVLQVLAAATLLSPVVQAQESASTQFTITGTAPKVCALPSPVTTGTASNATFASNAINITQFVDPNTALVTPSSLSLQFPNTLCNYNATVSLQSRSGGLVSNNASTVANGSGAFLQNVPYTVNASWGSFSLLLDTSQKGSSSTVSNQTNGATAGNLTLTIATAASTIPVLQGSYQDTLTLKIGAPM
jgi:hypothetical protein